MKIDDLLYRLDEIIKQGGDVLNSRRPSEGVHEWYVAGDKAQGFYAAALSFSSRHLGETDVYHKQLLDSAKGYWEINVKKTISILEALRHEMAGGWMTTTKSLVSAEIFTDFLTMANYFLSEGYKDAAAVMIGGILEEHIRQLCSKFGISQISNAGTGPKNAGLMNDELKAKMAYNALDHKQVIAWLDLRNKAAHGKYDEYVESQVKQMHDGVLDFLSRNPTS